MALLAFSIACAGVVASQAQLRPCMIITREDVAAMRASAGAYAPFDSAVRSAEAMLAPVIDRQPDVPIPVDAGGRTHERHKQNYAHMQAAGVLYALSGDQRYARFVRDMLVAYAELYPKLGLHPAANSTESGGRLFWQTLNETVWLVHVAQAYDCIYDWLSPADRLTIERGVLRPMARFFTEDHAREFDRIHNHGTWMVASVGMLGYALRDEGLVRKALYGISTDRAGGFLRQLDKLFSPDGYYAEGPYYTRYAVMPFFLFAQAIENNQPQLRIFAYRDSILQKVLWTTLQQTTPAGTFIPFNDALKDMSLLAKEIVTMVDLGYARYGGRRELLSVAARQERVMLSGAGLAVARGLSTQQPLPFPFRSLELRDGPTGDNGGVGLLRASPGGDNSLVVMKCSSQGMGHGHFDRLGLLVYDQDREVLQDYGSVRFINVETKDGGRYLPENKTWAKQTIAHNTVTVDGRSHFDGNLDRAESTPGTRRFFDIRDSSVQVMSATAANVAPGVTLQRTVLLVLDPAFSRPVIIDLLRAVSPRSHRYDLPFYYIGHLVNSTVPYTAYTDKQERMGDGSGYQHLWTEASGSASGSVQWTWLLGGRYYSVTSAADSGMQVLFARIGAGDPSFNLRNERSVILRRNAKTALFASVLEPHGEFEPVEEVSRNARPRIKDVRVLADGEEGSVVDVVGTGGLHWRVMVSNGTPAESAIHSVQHQGGSAQWRGNFKLLRQLPGESD